MAARPARRDCSAALTADVRTGKVAGRVAPVGGVVRAVRRVLERRFKTVKYVSSGPVSLEVMEGRWRKWAKELCSWASVSVR